MNYMTPELLARVRSQDDDVAEAAAEEWERRGEEYRKRLQEIRSRHGLPRGLRKLLNRDVLHDAKVLTLAVDEEGKRFSVFVELARPAGSESKRLELEYRLVGGPRGLDLKQHAALKGDGREFGWWLYDEIGVTEGKVELYTHSILFTGGWEVQLTFFSLACRPLDFFLLPGNGEGKVDPKEVARLEEMKRGDRVCV
jgi:hypothetical protein